VAGPAHEISAMTGNARMRPLEPQLQQKNTAFSVGCPVHEKSTMGSNAHMRQLESQSQQKNVAFSVRYNRNHEEFGQKHQTWEKKLDNQVNRMCEEFSCMLYKQL